MTAEAIPFPTARPDGYEWFDEEPTFDPAIHLDLRLPSDKTYLVDLGYSREEIATKSTPIAASGAYRVLSDEGAAVLLTSARRLREHHTTCDRIDTMVRGGVYRSKFLRDLCLDPSLTELMCEIFETDVAPHTMPVHLGHLNFEPDIVDKAVDKWHHDTLPCDFVMMVSRPRNRCRRSTSNTPRLTPSPASTSWIGLGDQGRRHSASEGLGDEGVSSP